MLGRRLWLSVSHDATCFHRQLFWAGAKLMRWLWLNNSVGKLSFFSALAFLPFFPRWGLSQESSSNASRKSPGNVALDQAVDRIRLLQCAFTAGRIPNTVTSIQNMIPVMLGVAYGETGPGLGLGHCPCSEHLFASLAQPAGTQICPKPIDI